MNDRIIIPPGEVHHDFDKARLGVATVAKELDIAIDIRLMTMWRIFVPPSDKQMFLEFAREAANNA